MSQVESTWPGEVQRSGSDQGLRLPGIEAAELLACEALRIRSGHVEAGVGRSYEFESKVSYDIVARQQKSKISRLFPSPTVLATSDASFQGRTAAHDIRPCGGVARQAEVNKNVYAKPDW